jgi:hypothetical protein
VICSLWLSIPAIFYTEEVGVYAHKGKEFLSVVEGLVKGMGVAFTLCGGCNPIIDRVREAKKIETIVKRTGLVTVLSPDETAVDLVILVGGRARCCVEKEETLTAISEYFVVKGEVPELMSYERQVCAILARLIKKVNLTKGRGNYDKASEKRSD